MQLSHTTQIRTTKKRRPIFAHNQNSPVCKLQDSTYQPESPHLQLHSSIHHESRQPNIFSSKNSHIGTASIHQMKRSTTPVKVSFSQSKVKRNPLAHIQYQRQSLRKPNFIGNNQSSQVKVNYHPQPAVNQSIILRQNSLIQLPNNNPNVTNNYIRPTSIITTNHQQNINIQPRHINTAHNFYPTPLQHQQPQQQHQIIHFQPHTSLKPSISHQISHQNASKTDSRPNTFYRTTITGDRQPQHQQSPQIIVTPPPHSDFTIIRKIQPAIVSIDRVMKPIEQNSRQTQLIQYTQKRFQKQQYYPEFQSHHNPHYNSASIVTRYLDDDQPSFTIQKKISRIHHPSTIQECQSQQSIEEPQSYYYEHEKIQQLTEINALLTQNYDLLYKEYFGKKKDPSQEIVDEQMLMAKSKKQIQAIFQVQTKKRLNEIEEIYKSRKMLLKKGATSRMKF